ncbi:MAG TPA: hypothetical protein VGB13_00765 [Candidatus Krumholzibacteria bacterium]
MSRPDLSRFTYRVASHFKHSEFPAETPEQLVAETRYIARRFFISPEDHLACAKRAMSHHIDVLAAEFSK